MTDPDVSKRVLFGNDASVLGSPVVMALKQAKAFMDEQKLAEAAEKLRFAADLLMRKA
jgi:hypothetical protein